MPVESSGRCDCDRWLVSGSSAADTENMNPDDVIHSVRKTSAANVESLDRQKMYNPNHYQDDVVCVHFALCLTIVLE